ncbi:3-hydroxyacyl-CoA dehydrogenase NAD-binding domain-containing protein [Saccharomonospora sp. NPDC046836]|uniref:3-hydroxyacyl-CoA dehydrogenase NAD-binding domain-containing protein n=1 Tax=Saccharomonospora sp. NPDC046836 TaxID=3156921 RepID=UPI0033F7F8D7
MADKTIVTTEFRGRTALLILDNPPVNTGNTAQRRALAGALEALAGADLDGVVIVSAGRHFYAGSDLREFDAEVLESPQLPDIIDLIERLPVPVVAAVNGLALGGGFELALGCDARICEQSAAFGFPEVTFGMLPGAGGTVRTARLIGVPRTIDLVTSARQVPATEALELGLVEAVVAPEDLVNAAVDLARARNGKTLARDRAVPDDQPAEVHAVLANLPKRARPNVRQAAETVVRGATLDAATAFEQERALFHELRLTEEARNLRYLFFARQRAAKALRSEAPPRVVHSVGIVGAGTMGAALARTFAARGFTVTVVDKSRDALAKLNKQIHTAQSLDALQDTDLVIEAVFEDMAVKQELLTKLEPVVRADTVLVSNTSYLDLDQMGAALCRPERFAGLHFFNPPDRNALVEVIRTAMTDSVTAATLGKIVGRLGKSGIAAEVGDGFVGNRVYADYRSQAEFCVEDGASPEEVDRACVELGFAIGPFAVADMSGLDIAWARRKRLAATRDPRQRYVEIPDLLCEAGRLGKKTGAGWYRYPPGARRGEPDPEVARIIKEYRTAKGIEPRPVSADGIRDRVLGSMVAAAAVIVGNGVARQASDIDVALTEGFGFPKALGGPLRALSERPPEELVRVLAAVYRTCPITFAILEPAARGEVPAEVGTVLSQVDRKETRR